MTDEKKIGKIFGNRQSWAKPDTFWNILKGMRETKKQPQS
jgi:hypothetical protein